MQSLKLTRNTATNYAVYGTLAIDGLPYLVTLEKPWLENEKYVSCIPAGAYIAKRFVSEKFGLTLEVQDVPNRDAILFHAGNLSKDTQGCILLGYRFGAFPEGHGIMQSADAMKFFRSQIIADNLYSIIIVDAL